jgi:hypothetical protein
MKSKKTRNQKRRIKRKKNRKERCSICLDTMASKLITLSCNHNHQFHQVCIHSLVALKLKSYLESLSILEIVLFCIKEHGFGQFCPLCRGDTDVNVVENLTENNTASRTFYIGDTIIYEINFDMHKSLISITGQNFKYHIELCNKL